VYLTQKVFEGLEISWNALEGETKHVWPTEKIRIRVAPF
jgi:hypothetical protein